MHIGLIPDGNRRWAKKHSLSTEQLMEHWFKNMFEKTLLKFTSTNIGQLLTEYSELKDVTELSLYVLSVDNLNRKDKSYETVYNFLNKLTNAIQTNQSTLTLAHTLKLNVIGQLHLLPKYIQTKITHLTTKVFTGNHFTINLALAYDPIKDMQLLTNPIIRNPNPRNQSPIDLVIRTSGEQRSSGFFPYHTLYSEWYYSQKLFPDFTLDDLAKAVKDFNKRNRRFGK